MQNIKNNRITELMDVLEEVEGKAVIWAHWRHDIDTIIKSIEDKRNIEKDILTADVRSIIFIEDTPRFYSSILPVLYKEIIYHTKQLMDKSLNNSQKLLHMRARPKIILLKIPLIIYE